MQQAINLKSQEQDSVKQAFRDKKDKEERCWLKEYV
jgi:hypothetical protein